MGFKYSESTKRKATELRKLGKSYNEIRKTLGIKSKGTLSLWFKEVELTANQRRRLQKNLELAQKRGLLEFNRLRTRKIEIENNRVFNEASLSIQSLSPKELLVVGTALYWGEGTKSKSGKGGVVSFSNSDPLMVRLFMRFLRETLAVPNEWIRGGIHIYTRIRELEARKFWSNITKISPQRFYIVNQISSASKRKRPKNKLPFGTMVIRVNKRLVFYKIKGYIEGLAKQV